MKLLGDWNWYLPRRLEWLPRLQVEGTGTTEGGRSALVAGHVGAGHAE
jgi:hypothetical protein